MEDKKLSYEEAMEELESILEDLEEDNCSLSESMEKFRKGIELYKYCSEVLAKSEGEIKILLGDNKESLEELSFFREEENEY